MTDHKCLPVLLVVNICVVLCASLPLSYKQTAETENVFNKLFPGDRRYMQEDWSRDERSMFQPLGERRSRFQSNPVSEMSLREKLLRDVLDWEKRRLEKAELDQSTTEKRGQLRCTSGYMAQWCNNGDTSTEQTERKREKLAFKEPGHAQMDEMNIDKVREYDMELEKALKRFEMKEPSNLHNQM